MADKGSLLDGIELSDRSGVCEGARRTSQSLGNRGSGGRRVSVQKSDSGWLVKLLVVLVVCLSIALAIAILTHPQVQRVSAPIIDDSGEGKLNSNNSENTTFWYLKSEEFRIAYETERNAYESELRTREIIEYKYNKQVKRLEIEHEKRVKLQDKLSKERERLGIFDIPVIVAIGGVYIIAFVINRFRGIKEPAQDARKRLSLTSLDSGRSQAVSPQLSAEAATKGDNLQRASMTCSEESRSSAVVDNTMNFDDVLTLMQNAVGSSFQNRRLTLLANEQVSVSTTTSKLSALSDWWKEWRQEIFPDNLQGFMDNFGAGVVTGTKFTTGMVAFSVLLYGSCEELEQNMPMGIKSNLWSCVISQILYCVLGGLPYGMALPQDIPCLLLGQMGAQLPSLGVPANQIIPTYMLLVSCQTLMCSLLFFLSYVTGLSKIVMQLPSSLLAGFVFGNGLGLLRAAGKQLTRVDWKYLWPDPNAVGIAGCKGFECLKSSWVFFHVLIGVTNFLCILMLAPMLKSRLLRGQPSCCMRLVAAFVSPCAMLCCIPPFYLAMKSGLFTMEAAREHEWLADPEPNPWDMRFWRFWLTFYNIWEQDITAVVHFLPDMFSVSVICLIEAAMGGCSVEATCPRHKPLDLGLELRAHAVENFVIGLTGGTTVFLQTGMTINAHRTDGATHRMAGLVASMICLTVFITGVPIATYAPRFMPGAVFLVVGYIMVKDSAFDTFTTMPLQEWLGILVIGFIFMIHGMEAAMIWGLFYAIFLFMAQSSAQSVVKDIKTADKCPSTKERELMESRILAKRRKKILVIAFQGCIFWGSVREMMDLLLPHLGGERVKYIIFDLREIQRVDGSACKALLRIVRLGGFQKVRFCFIIGEDAAQVEANLSKGLLIFDSADKESWDPCDWPCDGDRCPCFDDYNDCMAFCEDAILASCAERLRVTSVSSAGSPSLEPDSPTTPKVDV